MKPSSQILYHLPPYGDRYIPVTSDGDDKYASEGFVVRFYRLDGSSWVANFKPGFTECDHVKEYEDRVLVIAGGEGYVMDPNATLPVATFGGDIRQVFELDQGVLVVCSTTEVHLVDHTGEFWRSPRISWDGLTDLELKDEVLTGLSYAPPYDDGVSYPFTLNLKTRQLVGGGWEEFAPKARKKWWQFWKKSLFI